MNQPTRDLFRPSAIYGLIRLRRELRKDGSKAPEEHCRTLSVTYASSGFDVGAALHLHAVVAPFEDVTAAGFRQVLYELVCTQRPPWLTLLRSGRNGLHLTNADVRACFQLAGALEVVPDQAALDWLDKIFALAFAYRDADLLALGRKAEQLSFELERARLATFPYPAEPEWVALNDAGAGYDIRSACLTGSAAIPLFIEVKASERVPPVVHLTRNEWEFGTRMKGQYVFHVWHLPSETLAELTYDEMAEHVPTDRGQGRWEKLEVEIHRHPVLTAAS